MSDPTLVDPVSRMTVETDVARSGFFDPQHVKIETTGLNSLPIHTPGLVTNEGPLASVRAKIEDLKKISKPHPSAESLTHPEQK